MWLQITKLAKIPPKIYFCSPFSLMKNIFPENIFQCLEQKNILCWLMQKKAFSRKKTILYVGTVISFHDNSIEQKIFRKCTNCIKENNFLVFIFKFFYFLVFAYLVGMSENIFCYLMAQKKFRKHFPLFGVVVEKNTASWSILRTIEQGLEQNVNLRTQYVCQEAILYWFFFFYYFLLKTFSTVMLLSIKIDMDMHMIGVQLRD